jgi:hypothetical protein
VVAEHEAGVDVRAAVERRRADFVIVGFDANVDEAIGSLLAADRGVRALELRADGRDGVLSELRPHRVPLGEISPETLLHTIRETPAWNAET